MMWLMTRYGGDAAVTDDPECECAFTVCAWLPCESVAGDAVDVPGVAAEVVGAEDPVEPP